MPRSLRSSSKVPPRPGADVESPAGTGAIVSAFRATVVVNFLGLPSVALPVGLVNDLPQAVRIIGPRFAESLCLRAAEIVEAATSSITPIDPRPLHYSGGSPGQTAVESNQ